MRPSSWLSPPDNVMAVLSIRDDWIKSACVMYCTCTDEQSCRGVQEASEALIMPQHLSL